MSESSITITELTKRFGTNVVLDGISLTINTGDVLGVIGPSGTGKSTLLRCINLLERPEHGSITLGSSSGSPFTMDLTDTSKEKTLALRQRTAMVFQQFNLFRQKTALQNVMEGLVVVKKMPAPEAEALAVKELEAVGMGERLYHYPKHLSGGQQQRVAIARALAMKPEVLLFDEPTSALDPELVGEVLDTIQKTALEGYTMLLVSHEMNFIRKVANRIIFLEGGHIVEDGPPAQVFTNPKSERAREFIAKLNRLTSASGTEYNI